MKPLLRFAVKEKFHTEMELDFFVAIACLTQRQQTQSTTVCFTEVDLRKFLFQSQSERAFSLEVREFLERLHDPTYPTREPKWLTQGGKLKIDKQSGQLRGTVVWADLLWADLEECLPLSLDEYGALRGLPAKRQYVSERWELS